MKGGDSTVSKKQPWVIAIQLTIISWVLALLGPLSLLIIPIIIKGFVSSITRKSVPSAIIVMGLNPMAAIFLFAIFSYFGGAPSLWSMGLPGIESFNIDRTSRCFRSGGGCVVYGNEWVAILPHNTAIRIMSGVFGPPWKSYDGPYPTENKALALTANVPLTPLKEFQQGNVYADGETMKVGADFVEKVLGGLRFIAMRYPQTPDYDFINSEYTTRVQAKVYQDRCLIIRFSELLDPSLESDRMETEYMMFIDRENMRPFAYYTIKSSGGTRFHPVSYLSEHEW